MAPSRVRASRAAAVHRLAPADPAARGGTTGAAGAGAADEPGAFCSSAWCWSYPLPQGEQLTAIWSGGGTVVVGGNGGALMRWTGLDWQSIASDLMVSVDALWGSGPNDLWATDILFLYRFDGTSWRKVANPPQAVAGTTQTFSRISGSGPNDVWFSSHEAAYHWTGSDWSAKPYLVSKNLKAISASSASDVWAISDTTVYRWNGTDFDLAAWPRTTDLLQGLWVFGSNDVWINASDSYWHWDGQQFTVEPNVRASAGAYDSHSLFVTTPGDVWLAYGAHRVSAGSWTNVPVDVDLYSLPKIGAGLADGQIFLAGTLGRLWRLVNNRFVLTVPAVNANILGDLNAIWSDGKGTTFAGGQLLLRNTGNGWSKAPYPAYFLDVNAMWGRSASDVWAVGSQGFVYHYDGATWSNPDTGISSSLAKVLNLYAVAGTDTGEVWALGQNGQFLHYDGQTWTAGNTASVSDVHGIWVHNADDVWAAGGVVQRWTRTGGWQQITRPPVAGPYQAIWGTSESNVFVVSGTSAAYRYDGTKWQTLAKPANYAYNANINAIAGSPDGTFWAVGESGFTMRWNGTAFQSYATHASRALKGLWVGPTGEAWATGLNEAILHHR